MNAPSSPPPGRVALYVAAALLVLCCACFGLTGLGLDFGEPLLDALGLLR